MIERRLRNIVISRFGTSKEGGLIKITTSDGAHVLVSPRAVSYTHLTLPTKRIV